MILEPYIPESLDVRSDRLYRFTFPSVGAEAIEVYELLATGERIKARVQDYQITFASHPRSPLKFRGSVRFYRPHTSNTLKVRMERNTLIDQVTDFTRYAAFNTRMVEFTLDKLTMIAQEIAERKCLAATSVPITQEITFGSYWDISASDINFALDKITQILFEIDQSATDCRANVDNVAPSLPTGDSGDGGLTVSPAPPSDGGDTGGDTGGDEITRT